MVNKRKIIKKIFHPLLEILFLIPLFCMFIISLLPFKWGMVIGKHLGLFGYKLAKNRVRITKINLRKCFPKFSENRIEKLAKKTFIQATIGGVIEVSWGFFLPIKTLNQIKYNYSIPQSYYDSLGKQAIIIIPGHCTSLEILTFGIPSKNFIMTAVYRRLPFKVADWFFVNSKTKAEVQSTGHKEVINIIKCLKEKRVLWISSDQDAGSRTKYFVNFFNNKASCLDTVPRLAKKFKAKVFVHKVARIKNNPPAYQYHYQEIENIEQKTGEQIMTEYHNILTQHITKRPSQYLWLHKRFKTQPDNLNPYS